MHKVAPARVLCILVFEVFLFVKERPEFPDSGEDRIHAFIFSIGGTLANAGWKAKPSSFGFIAAQGAL
jgi:hypothetical protein